MTCFTLFIHRRYGLKVKTRIERESSVGDRIIRLVISRRICSRQLPEINTVNIDDSRCTGHEGPPRVIHDIHRVDADFELFPFGNPDALYQIHIEPCVGRSLDPGAAESSHSSSSGIREDDVSIRIRESFIAEGTLQRLQRGDAVHRRVGYLLQTGEIIRAAGGVGELSGTFREISKNERCVRSARKVDRSRYRRPGDFRIGSGNRYRGARTPAKDSAQLPPLHNPRYETRRVAQEFAAGSERQFERAIAAEIMRAVESEQALIKRAISRIPVFEKTVRAVFAQSPAPRVREIMGEAVRQTFCYLQLHRMVCGTAWICALDDCRVLGIRNDEVVGESIFCEQASGMAGDCR